MSDVTFTIDGVEVTGQAGQTILEAADGAGVYIPRLCAMKGLIPHGSCRICTVLANGRPQAACTQPVSPGMVVENAVPKVEAARRQVVEMLLVEGNHFCMFCEKSGSCELQALAYRMGIAAPRHAYQFPVREVDAGNPDMLLDRNRCVLCGRCVRASRELDHKGLFEFIGRGPHKRVAVEPTNGGVDQLTAADQAAAACPTGALLRKRVGYAVPVGQRAYDNLPIGSEIEKKVIGDR